MKDFRFYLEYPDNKSKRAGTRKDLGNHSGTCVALWEGTEHIWGERGEIMQDAFVGVYDWSDSACCFSSVSWGYLRERCKRISEQQASIIHPNLFYRIKD